MFEWLFHLLIPQSFKPQTQDEDEDIEAYVQSFQVSCSKFICWKLFGIGYPLVSFITYETLREWKLKFTHVLFEQ